ncbi:MAG: DUF427 domain-containing protein [Bacteroidota bacterium]
MKQAIWEGQILAESDDIVTVEGNAYFPQESIKSEFLQASDTTSFCGWKGDCSYYSVVVDGKTNTDAAWYYADPKPTAEEIRGRVAFWKGVEVRDV